MHDTALEIGRAAMELYAGGEHPKILEIGAMDVNGSLRQFASDTTQYLGVDLEPGKGVDMVVEPGKPLPFKDEAFDLILASSVFEHDPAFWMTFVDLARVLREGGHLYINAPSNGSVHRYPEDHWRFYPDSGLALERWAASQDLPVRLVESFTAPRKKDQWNDFVAVFRKGEREDELSGQFLYTRFEGTNVWTMGASQPVKPTAATEDMELLKAARDNARKLEGQIAGDREKASKEVAIIQSELSRAQEEIALVRRELEEARDAAVRTAEELHKKLAAAHGQAAQLTAARQSVEKQKEQEAKRAGVAEAELRVARENIATRFVELASLTKMLEAAENEGQRLTTERRWFIEMQTALWNIPWWWALLPYPWRRRKELGRLKSRALFDPVDYLDRYPDVAAEGMDPLRHYILHGMEEGRTLA